MSWIHVELKAVMKKKINLILILRTKEIYCICLSIIFKLITVIIQVEQLWNNRKFDIFKLIFHIIYIKKMFSDVNESFTFYEKVLNSVMIYIKVYCPVGWGCIIYRFLLYRRVRHSPHARVSWFDTKQSDAKFSIMQVAPDRVLSMGKTELNWALYAKLNCLKSNCF